MSKKYIRYPFFPSNNNHKYAAIMLMHIYEFRCVVRGGTISTLFQITWMKLITKRIDDFTQTHRWNLNASFIDLLLVY